MFTTAAAFSLLVVYLQANLEERRVRRIEELDWNVLLSLNLFIRIIID